MQIVICDDDEKVKEILKEKVERICREAGTACRVLCYSSGEEVLCAGQEPDLLFLDIQMPGRDGMEVAEELRRRQWDTILIFVTALSEYVYDAFDVGAFHYLVKPFEDDKLKKVVLRALEQCERQRRSGDNPEKQGEGNRQEHRKMHSKNLLQNAERTEQNVILVKRGGVSTVVPVENIIYAEVFNRKITLHTTGGTMEYYGKLTELSQQVGDTFYRTHRAYLVNLRYVERYNATTIWLEQGMGTVLVSKKQFSGFVKQYMYYLNRRGKA